MKVELGKEVFPDVTCVMGSSESLSGKNDGTSAAVVVRGTTGDARSLKERPRHRVRACRGVSVRAGESVWCTAGGRQGVRDDAAKSYRPARNPSDLILCVASRNGGVGAGE